MGDCLGNRSEDASVLEIEARLGKDIEQVVQKADTMVEKG
jgi:hypothetical protein